MEVSVQLHAPAAVPQGKSPQHPLTGRQGGPQNRFRRFGEYIKFVSTAGNRTRHRPVRSVVTVVTLLSGLHLLQVYSTVFL
jgi:hypothetical protein